MRSAPCRNGTLGAQAPVQLGERRLETLGEEVVTFLVRPVE